MRKYAGCLWDTVEIVFDSLADGPAGSFAGGPADGSGVFVRLRNRTPHPIHIVGDDRTLEIAPDGPPARLVLAPDQPDGTLTIDGVPVPLLRTTATASVADLPAPEPGTLLVVARPVAEALPERDDLAYPHRSVRDDRGAVIGCRALGRPARP